MKSTTWWQLATFFELASCIGIPVDLGETAVTKTVTRSPLLTSGTQSNFARWLMEVAARTQATDQRESTFINVTETSNIHSLPDLFGHLNVPTPDDQKTSLEPRAEVAASLILHNLDFPLDQSCTTDKARWWYRTYDGSCNWLRSSHQDDGQVGQPKSRDHGQHAFADGVSAPRRGPNARAVSNAFFRRNETIYYKHTPLLLGLVEFIMHDVTYSEDSPDEYVEVGMPADETVFPLDTTFRVHRAKAVPGTGTSRENPREVANMVTSWMDLSALYGSSEEVALKLRSFQQGKLLVQDVSTTNGRPASSYLPFNTMGVPTRTRPGADPGQLFAGGDARTNEDWILVAVHTLFLREHNRICDVLSARLSPEEEEEWDDERLYQTARLVLSAKYQLVGNSYQMAYFTDRMPWPQDDGFPLFRQMYGDNVLELNPVMQYPSPLFTKDGRPIVVSNEMGVVYRFHEFIIPELPLKDANNVTIRQQSLFSSAFNASGFIDAGLENILRGMTASTIPNFKSGVDENFRSAGKYRGRPFDIVAWSIVHEREQGLPTFNQYFRAYNDQDPNVVVPVRRRFEDFSSNAEMVGHLKRLYAHPDEVDLVVGCQLDEELFPGTTIPKSALIISLFSLIQMGNSDRFSIGYAMMRCLLVDKPWDCHPSNALEDLLWKSVDLPGHPNARFYDPFWVKELDLESHGVNLLWRLITENSDVKCLQRRPLFPYDPETNPLICSTEKQPFNVEGFLLTSVEVGLLLVNETWTAWTLALVGTTLFVAWVIATHFRSRRLPPVMNGWPLLGVAIHFFQGPKETLLRGFKLYGGKVFGMKLAGLTHYVITDPDDLDMMLRDSPYEVSFSLKAFMSAINFGLVIQEENFEIDLHARLVRKHLGDPAVLERLKGSIETAAGIFLDRNRLGPHVASLNDFLNQYIAFVVSFCIVGPDGFDDPGLLATFLKFNDDAIGAMGLSSLLPRRLQWIAGRQVAKDLAVTRKVLLPVVEKMRFKFCDEQAAHVLPMILDAVDDNVRAADLVTIIVWGGLVNLQQTLSSTVLDIINEPGLQQKIVTSLSEATTTNLDIYRPSPPWSRLRSAMFESIRLSGPITGPARIISEPVKLVSEPKKTLPRGQVATLSAYVTHRRFSAWGEDAAAYKSERFLARDPPVGSARYLIWGLDGPHLCPGRWFGQVMIQIMTKMLLERYEFVSEVLIKEDEKYFYTAGTVTRAPVAMKVFDRTC